MDHRPFLDYKRETFIQTQRRKAREPWGAYLLLALVVLIIIMAGD